LHEDPDLLSMVKLNEGWAQYLLQRSSFVKRKTKSKAKVTMKILSKEIITMDEIAPELIINFDRTGLNIVPVSNGTMAAAGAKRVEVAGKDDKKQLTALYLHR